MKYLVAGRNHLSILTALMKLRTLGLRVMPPSLLHFRRDSFELVRFTGYIPNPKPLRIVVKASHQGNQLLDRQYVNVPAAQFRFPEQISSAVVGWVR
jgi:hypothetical protein